MAHQHQELIVEYERSLTLQLRLQYFQSLRDAWDSFQNKGSGSVGPVIHRKTRNTICLKIKHMAGPNQPPKSNSYLLNSEDTLTSWHAKDNLKGSKFRFCSKIGLQKTKINRRTLEIHFKLKLKSIFNFNFLNPEAEYTMNGKRNDQSSTCNNANNTVKQQHAWR